MSDAGTRHRPFRIGTRSSPLARAQAAEVVATVREKAPDVVPELVMFGTQGDRDKLSPLSSMERGMFVREIDQALLDGQVDAAVHSAKDLPADPVDGLTIGAIFKRRDPRDVLINRWQATLADLPAGARLGTGSPRRVALLGNLRPDVKAVPIRGNVGTRLSKVGSDGYDGVVVAAAGLLRLGLADQINEYLDPDVFTPDVGQGALILQVRANDPVAAEITATANHPETRAAVLAERAFLRTIGGGCVVPVAAYAKVADGHLTISAMAASPDGGRVYREFGESDISDPEATGTALAEKLLASGAAAILAISEDSQ
jgi:hydroxymethylbilane synthase